MATVPLDIAFGDRESNLAAAADAVGRIGTRSDIVVLPELFSTGYTNNADEMRALADEQEGPTLAAVRAMAAGCGCAVGGSYAARCSDGGIYNLAFFVTPDGHAEFYPKRHLFSMSSEGEVFSAGLQLPPVAEFRGWKISIAVCYDLRFPAWMRNRDYAYDIMLLPANWPVARVYALEHLLIARAIENQAPIVCANRGGSDAYGSYDGCSFAFDEMGRRAFEDGSTTAVFDLADIRRARTRFPAARDADSFIFS